MKRRSVTQQYYHVRDDLEWDDLERNNPERNNLPKIDFGEVDGLCRGIMAVYNVGAVKAFNTALRICTIKLAWQTRKGSKK